MYATQQIEVTNPAVIRKLLYKLISIAYDGSDGEGRLRLKAPKRTMSAYACFSRSM